MRKTRITNEVMMMYTADGLDMAATYKKSKLLLRSYRCICWSAQCRADDLYDNACFCGSDLSASLLYLSDFAPDTEREAFESKVRSLFATEAMIGIVDNTIDRVRDFYLRGELYSELLSKSYLTRCQYRTEEVMELLELERSVYYDRLQEAILIFGYVLWGQEIPRRQMAFGDCLDARAS